MLDEDPAFAFVLPSVVTLFRTWRRAIGSLCKCLLEAEWSFVRRTRSVSLLGARFACPGVMGRVALPACVFSDLADQFASSRRLRSETAGFSLTRAFWVIWHADNLLALSPVSHQRVL